MSIQSLEAPPTVVEGRGRETVSRRRRQAAYAGALFALNILFTMRQFWAAEFLALIGILVIPGAILAPVFRISDQDARRCPHYIFFLSLAYTLLLSGVLAGLGTLCGIDAPLRSLLLLTVGFDLPLAACIVVGGGLNAGSLLRQVVIRPTLAFPVLALPVFAIAGTLRLNNGHGGAISILVVVLVLLTLCATLLKASSLSNAEICWIILACAASLLFLYSLRGDYPLGYDLSAEYADLHSTYVSGVWHLSHRNDAYGAMLSITAFPTVLARLTGIGDTAILKLVYPLAFSAFPLGVFWIARRFLSTRASFAAASFLILQTYFFQDMPQLARQEIALIFFIALITVLLDSHLARPSRLSLVIVFGICIVVSHYSTTYMTIVTVAIASIVLLSLFLLRRLAFSETLPELVCLAALGLTAFAWYGLLTHSAGNVEQFLSNVREHGLNVLPNAQPGSDLVSRYLQGNSAVTIDAKEYQLAVAHDYPLLRPYVHPFSDAGLSAYDLQNAKVPAKNGPVPALHGFLDKSALISQQAGNLVSALGAIALLVFSARRIGKQSDDPPGPSAIAGLKIGALACATLLCLIILRVSGTVASAYNQERAFLQALSLLSVTLVGAVAMRWHAAPIRIHRTLTVVALASLILLGGTTTGIVALLTGGDPGMVLTSRGEAYERLYVTRQEVIGAGWFGRNAPPTATLYADRYGQLRLIAYAHRKPPLVDIAPETLDKHAWIYLSRTNTVLGRVRAQTGTNENALYRLPRRFLQTHYILLYSNGQVEVYGS